MKPHLLYAHQVYGAFFVSNSILYSSKISSNRVGYVITLVTHPEELKKLKKFASLHEIVLKNQELYIK